MLSLKDSSKEYVGTYQLIIKSQPLSEDARTFLLPNHTFEKGKKQAYMAYKSRLNIMAEVY